MVRVQSLRQVSHGEVLATLRNRGYPDPTLANRPAAETCNLLYDYLTASLGLHRPTASDDGSWRAGERFPNERDAMQAVEEFVNMGWSRDDVRAMGVGREQRRGARKRLPDTKLLCRFSRFWTSGPSTASSFRCVSSGSSTGRRRRMRYAFAETFCMPRRGGATASQATSPPRRRTRRRCQTRPRLRLGTGPRTTSSTRWRTARRRTTYWRTQGSDAAWQLL